MDFDLYFNDSEDIVSYVPWFQTNIKYRSNWNLNLMKLSLFKNFILFYKQ